MDPEVQHIESLLQLCYKLPNRVHCIQTYPLTAPNGSTLLVIGHDNGLRIAWRGRRQNGHLEVNETLEQSNAVDQDDSSASESEGKGFEAGPRDFDPATPYEPINQHIDLPFGVAVLQLAFPHLPTRDSIQQNGNAFPSIVTKKLVVTVICSDASVRLVTLPLPTPSGRGQRKAKPPGVSSLAEGRICAYSGQIVTISSANDNRGIPRCVSMSFIPSAGQEYLGSEMNNDDDSPPAQNGLRDGRRVKPKQRARDGSKYSEDDGWDILVASCSSDLSGLLVIHRLSLAPYGTGLDIRTPLPAVPWTVQHIPSAPASVQFSPCLPHNKKNSMLLVAEAKGPVRIFSCLASQTNAECSWVVSLYPYLQRSPSIHGSSTHLLDAQWVLGGKAVLALFIDGEWGVWDLEGAGPRPPSDTVAPLIPTLGSFADFAIMGSVNAGPNTYKASSTVVKSAITTKTAKLAPTTPSTRRFRQENLFSGPTGQVAEPSQGGISIVSNQDTKDDESILLWHTSSIVVIPRFRTYWANKVRGSGNLFSDGVKGGARVINNISLRGEQRNGVCLLPVSNQPERHSDHDVLVLGETKFVIAATPFSPQQTHSTTSSNPPADQTMLDQGDLDLDGMDRPHTAHDPAGPRWSAGEIHSFCSVYPAKHQHAPPVRSYVRNEVLTRIGTAVLAYAGLHRFRSSEMPELDPLGSL
ncbi:MAG: hypothetical protein Q9218_002910 [Villophora microphyllina]